MANKRTKHAKVIDKVKMGKEQILKEVEAEEENGTNEETETLVDSTQDDIKSGI